MTSALPLAEVTDPVLKVFADEVGVTGDVAVAGSRTRWSVGGELADRCRVISAPKGIVEYHPEEMTVRVRAGTSVSELDQILAKSGQHTALPSRSGTVGGALAVGENCLRTLGRGRVRTCLLQVRYVSSDGALVTGGGTTVKNVSGFDLPRLMVGSLGTLGLFAEVLLRTNPTPEVSLLIKSDDVDPFEVLNVVLAPSMILWNGTTTWVELVGNPKAVDAEVNGLKRVGSFSAATMPPLGPHRWSLRPSDLPDCGAAFDTGDFVASIGVGTVFGEKPQPIRTLEPGVAVLHQRMKAQFDPAGRLNPGRSPAVR